MRPLYEPIDKDRQDAYLAAYSRCPQKASDYSFANILGWADVYGLEWCWHEDLVWLRQNAPEPVYWAPVGPWLEKEWPSCCLAGKTFIRVPEILALLWQEQLGDRVHLEEDRAQWDYVYSVPELIALKGNKFHRKKNLFNQFKKSYTYEYRPMDMECIEETLEMQHEWVEWQELKDSSALTAENQAIERILTSWDSFPGLMGGALHIDGTMVAYTVAEALSKDTVVIHFEKGKPNFRGIYQAINQMFLENQASSFLYVNREQDLDDPGLRKAKLSYNPVEFLKKYTVKID